MRTHAGRGRGAVGTVLAKPGRVNANTLVVGGTGLIGREVVASLYARGVVPRVLTRNPGRAARLLPGAWLIQGDLRARSSIRAALEGVRDVLLALPRGFEETRAAAWLVDACEAAGVRRLVLISSVRPDRGDSRLRQALRGVLGRRAAGRRLEARARQSGIETVILRPANLYQRDELHRVELVEGRYPQPLGARGVNRVDARDVGLAGARALLGDLAPGVYPIVGPQAWTGAECAALWSAALGRRVRYVGDNIETWARRVTARLPDTSVEALRDHYRELQRGGGRVDAEDLRRCAEALGRAPIPYARYVASAAGRWLSRPAPYLASDSSGAWR